MLVKPAITTVTPGSPAVAAQDEFHECVEFPDVPDGGGGISDPGTPPADPDGGYYVPTAGEAIHTWNGTYFADGTAPPGPGHVCAVHGADPFAVTPYPVLGGTGIGGVICGPAAVVDSYV